MKILIILFIHIFNIHADGYKHYFGGYSEVKANLPSSEIYSAPVVITAEIFSAKDDEEFDKAIEDQTQVQRDMKIIAKEFLENNNGHLFSGVSEGSLIFN